ncbi:MAG: hypothetical protein EHM42_15860, partial [Planctomycetaceae bacterium]
MPRRWPLWFLSPGRIPAIIALTAFCTILPALDPAGDHFGAFDGPGLTVDEPFNVGQGVMLVDRLLAGDFAGFREVDSRLPDHPPLGRLWIGVCHEAAFLLSPPVDGRVPYSVTCARTASAVLFAATIWLVGWCAGRWWGPVGGAVSAASLVLMPRMFGHAHLASLETAINLAYAACLFLVCDLAPRLIAEGNWRRGRGAATSAPQIGGRSPALLYWGSAAATGMLLGLALLTKVQAVFLPAALGLWALVWLRWRAP